MIAEDITNFLKNIPPFQYLGEPDLKAVAENLTIEFYPKGTVILKQDDLASDSLQIVKKGRVRVSIRTEGGQELIIDHRGEGDTFGLISMMGNDKQKTTVTAIEDATCYLLGRKKIIRLIESNPSFTEYFLQSHFTRYVDKVYRDIHNKGLFYGSSDHLLFTTPVGDIVTRDVITLREEASIKVAALEMANRGISSLIIIDSHGLPVGIVTDRDLCEKVVARGRNIDGSVRDIMSLPLVRIDVKEYCFEAVLKMFKHNVHHILVIRDGKLSGVLTEHDLMLLQGTSPLSLAKDLEYQENIVGLAPISSRINRLVGILLREGARASNITRIIAELNDRLVRKVLENAEKQCGRPPVAYSWFAFGSEGRREQIFKTDQDNGIVYADPSNSSQDSAVRAYFTRLALSVREGLMKCGYPYCPDDTMAVNPKWCQPLSVWKKHYSSWLGLSAPDTVLRFQIFFDLRYLHGDEALAAELSDYVTAGLKDRKVFLQHLVSAMIKSKPSLGFFKTFLVDKDGEYKDQLNLKECGIGPIVDIIRLFSFETGVHETSTLDRIEAMKGKHPIIDSMGDELAQAFEFILLLRTRHQAEQYEQGRVLDNYIDPAGLSSLDKRILKESFQVIGRVQAKAAELIARG